MVPDRRGRKYPSQSENKGPRLKRRGSFVILQKDPVVAISLPTAFYLMKFPSSVICFSVLRSLSAHRLLSYEVSVLRHLFLCPPVFICPPSSVL